MMDIKKVEWMYLTIRGWVEVFPCMRCASLSLFKSQMVGVCFSFRRQYPRKKGNCVVLPLCIIMYYNFLWGRWGSHAGNKQAMLRTHLLFKKPSKLATMRRERKFRAKDKRQKQCLLGGERKQLYMKSCNNYVLLPTLLL